MEVSTGSGRHSNSEKTLWRFLRDEKAQATTEYILILAVLVSIAILLIRDLIRPTLDRISTSLTKRIDELFKPGAMHRSPFRK